MDDLKNTPLVDQHRKLNALMAPFGGWNMPIQYEGIIAEHRWCREKTALFDICHMGEFLLRGDLESSGIEQVFTFSVKSIPVGRSRYGFLLNDRGGIIDDLIVFRLGEEEAMIVVNAATIDNDFAVIRSRLSAGADFTDISLLIDTASSSGASAFENAYLEVASGRSEHVLAIGIQKMSDVSTAEATRIVAGVIDRDEAEFGLTMPACGALVARSLMERLHLSMEEWTAFSSLLSERAHRFAARNPNAHLRFELPVPEYHRQIANRKNYRYWWPLRYHDFCPMSDGVAAVILTAEPQEVMVTGIGSATDIPTIADRNYFHSFPATVAAAEAAYGMAGVKDVREFAGRIHINMHDPFNGFGPINMVDLGIVPQGRLLDALLDDDLTGENGMFPTNLTGGLKGRGHPLGATGMIQVVENHRMIVEGRFKAGLSHSIGGPINNNIVILLEQSAHYERRSHEPYKPWGLPSLGKLKPKEVTVERLLAESGAVEGTFVSATTRFDYKSGEPESVVVIVSCRAASGKSYRFLFGIPGENYEQVRHLASGDRIRLERINGDILLNRMPIRRFYQKTIAGVVELAGSGWKRLTGKGGSRFETEQETPSGTSWKIPGKIFTKAGK